MDGAEIEKLQAENKKLRECLEFYANEENWAQVIDGLYNLGKIWVEKEGRPLNTLTLECGERARQCLEKTGA